MQISLSFLDWLAVSVPFCLVSTGVIFAFLLFAHGGGLPANVVGPWSSGYVPGDDMEIALIGRSGSQEARSIDDSDDDGDDGEDDAAGGAAKPSPENLTSDSGVTTRVPSPANTDEPYAVLTKTDVWEREGETKGSPKAPEGGVSGEDVLIVVLILLTFISWIFFRHLKPYFGSIGILALMPIVLFGGRSLPCSRAHSRLDTFALYRQAVTFPTAASLQQLCMHHFARFCRGGQPHVARTDSPPFF